MMINALNKIYKFNTESGLLAKGYNSLKESEYLIEEALEELDTHYLAEQLGLKPDVHPKVISRKLVTGMCLEKETSMVALVDRHVDALVFNIGALMKLGLTNVAILRCLNAVCDANNTKLSAPLDEHGKQTKPADFVPPEAMIEQILKDM